MRKRQQFTSFESNVEYLSSTLEYLGALAEQRIAEQGPSPGSGSGLPRPGGRRDGGGIEAESRSAADKVGQNGLSAGQARRRARRLRAALNARIDLTLSEGKIELPLEALAHQEGLCEFEKLTMAAVLGWSLDNQFRRVLGVMCASRNNPEVRVVLDLLCDTLQERIRARTYFISTGTLMSRGLLHLSHTMASRDENDFMNMHLELPRGISSRILGEYHVNDQLVSFSSIVEPEADLDQVVLLPGKKEEVLSLVAGREASLICRRAWGLDRVLPYGKGMVIMFSGPSGTGKTLMAHALAKATGHRLMLVDAGKIRDHSRGQFDANLRSIFHEARLRKAITFFDEADELFKIPELNPYTPTLLREFERVDGICILATNRPQVLDEAMDRRIMYTLEFEHPSMELREQIWKKHLPPELPLAADVDIKALAEAFDITGGLIKNAVLLAMQRAVGRSDEDRRVSQEDLRRACLAQVQNRLKEHTDKIAPHVNLDDVVLPEKVRAQVQAVIGTVRQRSTVFTAWGFSQKLSLGRATTILLSGESGVGKTMTAEAIAGELGQALYVVRLAAVLSRWVAETEQNLDSVFEEAHKTQALLFFDEADALFSTRLDEPSHHARYINQQINVLLKCIEQFDGIVILATNRPAAFDAAFERRIRYRINLPHPDAAGREAIWRRLLPSEAPIAPDINFAALAKRYEFTGGTIRNVLLRAAFAAANDGRVITQELLERSAEEESPLQPRREMGFAPRRGWNGRIGRSFPDPLLDSVAVEFDGGGE